MHTIYLPSLGNRVGVNWATVWLTVKLPWRLANSLGRDRRRDTISLSSTRHMRSDSHWSRNAIVCNNINNNFRWCGGPAIGKKNASSLDKRKVAITSTIFSITLFVARTSTASGICFDLQPASRAIKKEVQAVASARP